ESPKRGLTRHAFFFAHFPPFLFSLFYFLFFVSPYNLRMATHTRPSPQSPKSLYARIPLYIKIMAAMALGVALGYAWKPVVIDTLQGPPATSLKPWGDLEGVDDDGF